MEKSKNELDELGKKENRLFANWRKKKNLKKCILELFYGRKKNPLITMYKHYNLLSNLGGCQDWCTKVDELLNSIVDETNVINEWQ